MSNEYVAAAIAGKFYVLQCVGGLYRELASAGSRDAAKTISNALNAGVAP